MPRPTAAIPENDLITRSAFAIDVAREAGDLTLQFFRGRFEVDTKADGSVVTTADREAEALIRRRIEAAFPADAILGEEHGESGGSSRWRWVIDPIDGTVSFVHRVPLYGTLVAVEYQGTPVIGVIHMPVLGETVSAAVGRGCWHARGTVDPTPARVSGVDRIDQAMLLTTSIDYFTSGRQRMQFLELVEAFGATRGWSDCYAHVLVATGRAEVVIEPAVNIWDVAPMVPIMTEAGGRFCDFLGVETASGGCGVSTNGILHEQVLSLLAT